MNRAFLVFLVAVLLGACGPKIPDLATWDASIVEVSESGTVYYKYTRDDEILEVLANYNGELMVITHHRRDKIIDYVKVEDGWQRGHIVDVVEDEPSGRISIRWETRGGEEIETRF